MPVRRAGYGSGATAARPAVCLTRGPQLVVESLSVARSAHRFVPVPPCSTTPRVWHSCTCARTASVHYVTVPRLGITQRAVYIHLSNSSVHTTLHELARLSDYLPHKPSHTRPITY